MAWSLLHLHGVGAGVQSDRWYTALTHAVGAAGVDLPPRDSDRVLVPVYHDLLTDDGGQSRAEEPARTAPFPGSATEQLRLRARWMRDQATVLRSLPQYDSLGFNGFGATLDPTTNALLKNAHKNFAEARRYLGDANLRAAVLQRVLASIQGHHDLVVVAHSLGSVVAIDLLNHLPPGVRIRRLISVGSPAGTQGFHRSGPERLLDARNFPFHLVDSWINLFSPWDPVTFGRGLGGVFPAAGDVRIDLPRWEHAAELYLAHPNVARVVADAVRPTVAGTASSGALELTLDRDEALALDHLVFAGLLRDRLSDERRERFSLALARVAEATGRTLADHRRDQGRSIPRVLHELSEGRTEGLLLSDRGVDEQLLLAVVAATDNPIAPYEVAAAKETAAAVGDLWSAWGHAGPQSQAVTRALREAGAAFDPSGGWRWAVLGAAGLAMIAIPPLGIAAGGAGLAGGAALTTGLAAFGPGGLVGGMALAGSLIGVGSASVAASVRLPGRMSPDQLQTHLVRYLAFARAHQLLQLNGAPLDAWYTITAWYDEVSAQIADLSLLSDDNSPTLKQARAKQELLRKALSWLTQKGLGAVLTDD